ncbi:hypothetical protein [Aeromonas caviae]|uniref:hypothetical protein n=1 Tax=Aeromonas caviae TaxID=648 RepID=UPI001CF00AE1|nr:hypothetical protein [Aeromonas caviae]UCM49375.1 hypothetical protein LEO79_00090 [Aeromonas caviae]
MKLDIQRHEVSHQPFNGNNDILGMAGISAGGVVSISDSVKGWKRLWDLKSLPPSDHDVRSNTIGYHFYGSPFVFNLDVLTDTDTGKWGGIPVINIAEQQNTQYNELVNSYYDELSVSLYADTSEVGESSKFKDLMIDLYQENQRAFLDAYQKLWVHLYEGSEHDVLCLLILKSALVPYSYFSSHAKVMVCGCASNVSVIVQEAMLKAVDMWGDPEFINILEQMRPFDLKWLEDYRLRVIECLKRKENGAFA